MPEIITINSFPQFQFLDETELTDDVAEGATSLPIANEDLFDTDHAILIGNPGDDNSLIAEPSAVADEAITVSSLDRSFSKGTKVYKLRANKAKVYAASNVDGSKPTDEDDYSELGEVTFRGDRVFEEYSHASGGSDYWYIYTFYNDVPDLAEETQKILTAAKRGGGHGDYVTVDSVKKEAGFARNNYIERSWVQEAITDAQSEVKGTLSVAGYVLPISAVPGSVRRATLLIAAGFLLMSDYGFGANAYSQGKEKVEQGREMLMSFLENTVALINDTTESELDVDEDRNVDGYPDDTTKDNDETLAGGARMFTIKQKL